MTAEQIISIVLTAFLGGSGLVGMAFWLWKRALEKRDKQAEEVKEAEAKKAAEEQNKMDETREQIKYLVDHGEVVDATLKAMATENTLQCYCLLSCLRGLAEQGCNGPVHDGIDKLEKYLNQKAHGEV